MNSASIPFITGDKPPTNLPLDRYLPAFPPGMASRWLEENCKPGAWILDPFGANPAVALETASAGYRVLVAVYNPIMDYILEALASAPQFNNFQAALTELSALRLGDERLSHHLQSLYNTICPECGRTIQASAFLWQKDQPAPYARIILCPFCKTSGEFPVTEYDIKQLHLVGNPKLYKARILQRVFPGVPENDLPPGLQDAIQSYLPRSLYFLFTVINKIENNPLSLVNKRLLGALLLSVFDTGNTLWPVSSSKPHPRQIITSPQFRENNLWLELEASIKEWCSFEKTIPLSRYPDLPPVTGGICIYKGRVKNLLPNIHDTIQISGVISAIPHPGQAFLTYSGLWSGCLWGRTAVEPVAGFFQRQRYDYNWMVNAFFNIFSLLNHYLSPDTKFFALLSELSPGYIEAILLAAELSGFQLNGLALRDDQDILQATWALKTTPSIKPSFSSEEECIRDSVHSFLLQTCQPASSLQLFTASILSLISNHTIKKETEQPSSKILKNINNVIQTILDDKKFLHRFEKNPQGYEISKYWLNKPCMCEKIPLDDQIEIFLSNYLQQNNKTSLIEVDRLLCKQFPGLSTPSMNLVQTCLESYCEEIDTSDGVCYQLRSHEKHALRLQDLQEIQDLIVKIGNRLGYRTKGENPLIWENENRVPEACFYLLMTSVISQYIYFPSPYPPQKSFLVFPGSRASLLAYKLKRDPRISQVIAQGWQFLKYRRLREISNESQLTIDLWSKLITEDPPTWKDPVQMKMFN